MKIDKKAIRIGSLSMDSLYKDAQVKAGFKSFCKGYDCSKGTARMAQITAFKKKKE